MIATKMVLKLFLFLTICCGLPACALGQEASCTAVASMLKMVHARSVKILTLENQKAGGDYRARVVFAARKFELHPQIRAFAIQLLNLIPQNDAQKTVWLTFGDSLCENESIEEMKSLGRLGQNLSRNLAKAVLLIPDKMPAYVLYAIDSVRDPHSDYAVQMRSVCVARSKAFKKAVQAFSQDKNEWFVKHVVNPDGCRVMTFPEAE
jgi:hypothetical protein